MIGINAIEAMEDGWLVFEESPDSTLKDLPARVSRYGTLDGGAEIVHEGVSDGDRTFTIRARLTEADEAILRNIFETQGLVELSTPDGCYEGAISGLSLDNGDMTMTFLPKEKLSA